MAQNVVSLIFGQFVSNLDTKRIFERSSHWKHKIIPQAFAQFYSQMSEKLRAKFPATTQ